MNRLVFVLVRAALGAPIGKLESMASAALSNVHPVDTPAVLAFFMTPEWDRREPSLVSYRRDANEFFDQMNLHRSRRDQVLTRLESKLLKEISECLPPKTLPGDSGLADALRMAFLWGPMPDSVVELAERIGEVKTDRFDQEVGFLNALTGYALPLWSWDVFDDKIHDGPSETQIILNGDEDLVIVPMLIRV